MYPRRRLVHGAVVLAIGLGMFGALVRCADVNRGLGEACIRNGDCLSSLCAGSVCVADPTLMEASTAVDTGVDAGIDASDAASMDVVAPPPKDTGAPTDSGKRPTDAAPDTQREASSARDGSHRVDARSTDASGRDATSSSKDGTVDSSKDAHPAG